MSLRVSVTSLTKPTDRPTPACPDVYGVADQSLTLGRHPEDVPLVPIPVPVPLYASHTAR